MARRPDDPEAEKRRRERRKSLEAGNLGLSKREMSTKDRPERWSSRKGYIHDERASEQERNLCNQALFAQALPAAD